MSKNELNWTFSDMVRAFNRWKDMDRDTEYMNFMAVKQAWDEYTAIRDAIDYRPFPSRMLVVRPARKKRNQGVKCTDRT